jgi:hypothetical protein
MSQNANAVLAHTSQNANAVIDPATGASLEYNQLRQGPDSLLWIQATENEIGRLAQGFGSRIPQGTDTMHFIHPSAMPSDRTATYLRIVAAHKPNKSEPHRIRFTVGGDRIVYAGKVSTPTADITTVKILLNSVLSTPDARFMSVDIKDFYLNTPMARYEYMKIPVKDIPDSVMAQYQLTPLARNGSVLVEIRKGMYGLPQAGILANDRLQAHLATAGYHPVKHTPGLYRHATRPITFTLVVDDFGVKYVGREHAEHLIATLRALYTITTDWDGALYLGMTLAWDYTQRTVDCSMPGYVSKALLKFQHPTPAKPQHSPHAWIAPSYGATTQLTAPPDLTAPLDAAGLTRLQEIVGTLLYYARAIDSTMLVALGTIASSQATGTQATAQAVTQLLNYCASHPDAVIRYHASGMVLRLHSDASYLSETRARSRAAGWFFLSDAPTDPTKPPLPEDPPAPDNGPIHVLCAIMAAILSSAMEAELGALFYNAKDATTFRTTLIEMGHPQPATPIQTDNSCAAGIVNSTVKQRRSKAIDMRFYWVKDRVEKGEFLIYWARGKDNLADYFTKHHSPAHHRLMRSRYLLDLHRTSVTST